MTNISPNSVKSHGFASVPLKQLGNQTYSCRMIQSYPNSHQEYEQDEYRSAIEEMKEGLELVERELRTNWACVEMLASALLRFKTLSKKNVFSVIGKYLSDEAKARASAVAESYP